MSTARDPGGQAFSRPASVHANGNYVHDEPGMSYRDWLVGGMMREFFLRTTSDAEKLASALAGDQQIRDAVMFAHRVADEVMKERYE